METEFPPSGIFPPSGMHRGYTPCGSKNMTFLNRHVTTELKYHVTLWVGSPHPKSPPC